NGVKTQIRRSVGEHQEYFDECLNYFRDYYRKHCFANTIAYAGMIEVIKMLNQLNIQTICITNKPDEMAHKILGHVYGDAIDVVFGGRDGIPVKPDPLSTNMILNQYGLLPEECLFIGDTYVDIETGHNANMKTIGCLWGFRDINELQSAGADYIVATPEELGGLLNDLYERMSGRM
ncbi:MAG: HAD family hydrolase, partial [Erysipelotrichaceae bacterium]|nr:HAD family hydrolase [Erysipelotrichaceae bacterium]